MKTAMPWFRSFLTQRGEIVKALKIHTVMHLNTRNFLEDNYGYPVTIGNIIEKIKTNDKDVYIVLNSFVTYLDTNTKITNRSLDNYVAAVKSYLQFNDIDVSTHKFKNRVVMPKQFHEDEQAINHEEIREILKACNNP
ncbi:MAG: hypothetical protein ACRD97_06335 [Nitrososphaeraceae archaeon]